MDRRSFMVSAIATAAAGAAHAQSLSVETPSPQPFGRFADGGLLTDQLSPSELAERFTRSTAPAGRPGSWVTRAALPVPTSEMGGAAVWAGRMHIIGGWIKRADHHIYDPAEDRWYRGAPLPRTGNHVPVVADAGRVYALGGMADANTNPFTDAYFYEIDQDRWTPIAPLPRARGAGAADVLDGRIHLVGGAAAPNDERASVPWHEVYDPRTDSWTRAKPLPGARDHLGMVSYKGSLYVMGGRFNTPGYNTDSHYVYLPDQDNWEARASMPTVRSAHGLVVYRDRLFAMGGEGMLQVKGKPTSRVLFGQMESYDPATDTWQQHASMPTPRHGPGVVTVGDHIYAVGGGAVMGGAVQAAANEVFSLS